MGKNSKDLLFQVKSLAWNGYKEKIDQHYMRSSNVNSTPAPLANNLKELLTPSKIATTYG